MKLLDRQTNCTGIHRSGWPCVMQAVKPFANGEGVLLDDFVEQSFVYQVNKTPHRQPWVGIFHHPATINSPLLRDNTHNALKRTMERSKNSFRHLKGVVVLAQSSVKIVRKYVDVPIIVLKHPTGTPTKYWQFVPRAWQVGFFLRDTRFIFSAPLEDDWCAMRSTPYMDWMANRDKKLQQFDTRAQVNEVQEVPRVDDFQYDDLMASSVVYTHLFGAAANNVVVECIKRHTPIVVNRIPETEYYLGKDYPLFFNGKKVTEEQCMSASRYLCDLEQDSAWLNVETFSSDLLNFVQGIEHHVIGTRNVAKQKTIR